MMDMSSSTTSSGMTMSTMSSMSMVFTSDHSTPLYSSAWTPSTSGTYAATCIFLAILAVIARLLQAWRTTLEQRWQDRALNRRYVVLAPTDGDRSSSEGIAGSGAPGTEKSDDAILTVRGVDERVRIVRSNTRSKQCKPWRLSVDLPRACVYTMQAGVGYLLMLGVMTLNVGYFLSVLAGLFAGELVIGRYAHNEDDHH